MKTLGEHLYNKLQKSRRTVKRLRKELRSESQWAGTYMRSVQALEAEVERLQTRLAASGVLLDQYAEAVNQRTAELQAADREIDMLKIGITVANERADIWRTNHTGLREMATAEDDARVDAAQHE